ncbi:sensor histidine kinase [Mucilaginibacter aquaedulcis]|uniref:sensor histidine kinase n=1 Tax=Mucilaginibacter aquaedulcis TaxID=1187081 RepID=UPI0025B281CC|nr:histidine kinase [Mucilaginibacter aquaedulcis]MDN3551252.1 histidine kinase [Mucilaginibacter aquaedulcis]
MKLTMPVTQLNFVFSGQFKWRACRHITFWFSWYVFQVYLYSFTPSPVLNKLTFWQRVGVNLGESFWYMFPALFLTYTLLYWVIPNLVIPAKYFKAILAIISLLFVTGGLSALVSLTVIEYYRQQYLLSHPGLLPGQGPTPFAIQLFLAWISGLRGSITIGGLAAAIKLMKYFYEKQQHALILEQEKAVAELHSLKAQLHPHFLFNTLNNIYAHAQDKAPVAADMLLGLSALLRYMLYSCNAPLVPLKQELDMLLEYMGLEKQRYGNNLEISVQLPVVPAELLIAPLMILPFIENCFKHGTSDVLEMPWINIQLNMNGDSMSLKIINGKTKELVPQPGGIGIDNVRKRLNLLYPQRHDLQILAEEEMYIVTLNIELNRKANYESAYI